MAPDAPAGDGEHAPRGGGAGGGTGRRVVRGGGGEARWRHWVEEEAGGMNGWKSARTRGLASVGLRVAEFVEKPEAPTDQVLDFF